MKAYRLLFLSFFLVLFSCSISNIEDFVVGDNFVSDDTGVMMIDTLSIRTSTVKFDSISSSSTGRLLVGSNYNSFSGYKSSAAFMQMVFTDNISNKTIAFDSLCLVLSYDSYFSGDTTVRQTFSVHRLLETLEPNKNDIVYTTTQFGYDPTPLGVLTTAPKPRGSAKMSIRLSDELGERLTGLVVAKNDTLTNESLFLSFFKGLVLKTGENIKGAAVGFRTSSSSSSNSGTSTSDLPSAPEMRLYYHLDPNPDNQTGLYYKFVFSSGSAYFNQIADNKTGTVLENIEQAGNELSSGETGDKIFVQSGVQLFSKFRFPHLDNLLTIGENSGFLAARLILHPLKGTYSKYSELPDSLYIYSSERKNKLSEQVKLPGSSSVYALARVRVVRDVEETVTYEADVTEFIKSELEESLETSKSMMIGYGESVSGRELKTVVFGGAESGKNAPELKIYYYHN